MTEIGLEPSNFSLINLVCYSLLNVSFVSSDSYISKITITTISLKIPLKNVILRYLKITSLLNVVTSHDCLLSAHVTAPGPLSLSVNVKLECFVYVHTHKLFIFFVVFTQSCEELVLVFLLSSSAIAVLCFHVYFEIFANTCKVNDSHFCNFSKFRCYPGLYHLLQVMWLVIHALLFCRLILVPLVFLFSFLEYFSLYFALCP